MAISSSSRLYHIAPVFGRESEELAPATAPIALAGFLRQKYTPPSMKMTKTRPGREREGGREGRREREGGKEREGGRERGRGGGREREGGREAADVDTTRAPTGLNLSPCQRLG